MKALIVGAASLILALFCYSFNNDFAVNRQANTNLRVVCEEASVAGTLFIEQTQFSNGKIVFNKDESNKAIEAIISSMLKLDGNFNTTGESYWQDKICHKVYFHDDSNTVYPHLFTDPDTGFIHLVKAPTIIVTINAGKGRYALEFLQNGPDNIRSAAHTWEGR